MHVKDIDIKTAVINIDDLNKIGIEKKNSLKSAFINGNRVSIDYFDEYDDKWILPKIYLKANSYVSTLEQIDNKKFLKLYTNKVENFKRIWDVDLTEGEVYIKVAQYLHDQDYSIDNMIDEFVYNNFDDSIENHKISLLVEKINTNIQRYNELITQYKNASVNLLEHEQKVDLIANCKICLLLIYRNFSILNAIIRRSTNLKLDYNQHFEGCFFCHKPNDFIDKDALLYIIDNKVFLKKPNNINEKYPKKDIIWKINDKNNVFVDESNFDKVEEKKETVVEETIVEPQQEIINEVVEDNQASVIDLTPVSTKEEIVEETIVEPTLVESKSEEVVEEKVEEVVEGEPTTVLSAFMSELNHSNKRKVKVIDITPEMVVEEKIEEEIAEPILVETQPNLVESKPEEVIEEEQTPVISAFMSELNHSNNKKVKVIDITPEMVVEQKVEEEIAEPILVETQPNIVESKPEKVIEEKVEEVVDEEPTAVLSVFMSELNHSNNRKVKVIELTPEVVVEEIVEETIVEPQQEIINEVVQEKAPSSNNKNMKKINIDVNQKHTIVSLDEYNDYNYKKRLRQWRQKAGYNEEPQICFVCGDDNNYATIKLENGNHICYHCWIKKTTNIK